MKLPKPNLNRFFGSAEPRLSTAGHADDRAGTSYFSSRNGGGSGNGGEEYGFPDDEDETRSTEAQTDAPRAVRGGANRGNTAGGRQRTIQFQPEDRYWTEYLRIALPIIGLILMLGLFWYWATNIIGDDDTTNPEPTSEVGVVSTIDAQPTATEASVDSTVAMTQEATEPSAEPTEESAEADGGAEEEAPTDPPAEEEEPTAEPEEEEPAAESFAPDDVVAVNDEGVNMRAEPSTSGEVVTTLSAGDELIIVDGPESADDYEWYEVVSADGESSGFVAADFIEAAP
ncbi:MAG: SH3 domain-containing protein [Thermomicrobiales bacterium]